MSFRYQIDIAIKLNGLPATKLAAEAEKRSLKPEELADEIMQAAIERLEKTS